VAVTIIRDSQIATFTDIRIEENSIRFKIRPVGQNGVFPLNGCMIRQTQICKDALLRLREFIPLHPEEVRQNEGDYIKIINRTIRNRMPEIVLDTPKVLIGCKKSNRKK